MPKRRRAHAQAADYPARKVTFIVGFAPGGGVDTMARIVAQELAEQFGYQIVIENRPGAASNIAAKAVASAPPDGYTFLFTGNSLAINQTLYKNPTYSIDELRAVAIAAIDSHGLAVNASRPFRTLAEFLDASHEQGLHLRLRRIVGADRGRIRLQGAGQDAGRRGPVPERRAGHECAAGQPRRHHRRARSPRSIPRSSRAPCGRWR